MLLSNACQSLPPTAPGRLRSATHLCLAVQSKTTVKSRKGDMISVATQIRNRGPVTPLPEMGVGFNWEVRSLHHEAAWPSCVLPIGTALAPVSGNDA